MPAAVADYRRIVSPAQKSFSEVYGMPRQLHSFKNPLPSYSVMLASMMPAIVDTLMSG